MSSITSRRTRETLEGVLSAWVDRPSEELIVQALTIVAKLYAAGKTVEAATAADRVCAVTGIEVALHADPVPVVEYNSHGRFYSPPNFTRH